jgi:hypothetical protein
VRFAFDPLAVDKPKLTQTVTRAASGLWTLSIKGLLPATWVGSIQFTDQTKTHAATELPVTFELLQGVEPTPNQLQQRALRLDRLQMVVRIK